MKNYNLYDITEITNLKQLLYFDNARTSDKVAFMYAKGKKSTIEVTYSKFIQDIEYFGTYLYGLEKRNTHIAVMGENSYEWILTYFSTVLGGNVIVPIDKALTTDEVENVLVCSDSTTLVYSDTYSDIIEDLVKKNLAITFINMKDIPNILEQGGKLLQEGNLEFVNFQVKDEDLAAIVYTSGTTGERKGVMLTHGNIASNTVASCKNVYADGTTVCVLPLHHTFAFTLGICAVLLYRQSIYINKSLKNIMSDFQKAKPSYTFMVPLMVETMYKKVWATAKEQGKDKLLRVLIKFSRGLMKVGIDLRRVLFKSVLSAFGGKLEWVSCGGASIDIKYIQGFRDFGINIINGYGITECSPIVSSNRPQYWVDGSVGVVVWGCEVMIAPSDIEGEGEILVKGSGVMKGYYKNQEATKQAFCGEWFRTGDIGFIDEYGALHITGRIKNLIILSNGENIPAESIEEAVYTIPYVKEVVAYGKDNVIVAEVFLDEDVPDARDRIDADIQAVNKKLPLVRNIGKVVVRDTEFEKTTTNKIKRNYGGSNNAR